MTLEENVEINIVTRYLAEQSGKDHNVFAYRITIKNNNDQVVQLQSRYWLITDGNLNKKEVHGDGVVGEQPYIKPNESYEYESGVGVESDIATMSGYYQMQAHDGELFKVSIPTFRLALKNKVQ